jgi:sulfatase maturation enzyme AslB (radical SAM superfamily)
MISLAHRIVLTEDCNRACPHCFNADQREGKHMDTEKLFNFWISNQEWLKNAELKIMGGEPTIHPEFLSVASFGILLFNQITLFTNGTNMKVITNPDILAAHWGDKFKFIINAFTFNLDDNWQQWGKYYKRASFHFVLGEKKTIEKAKLLAQCIAPVQAHFILSGDTQINIFDDKYLGEYRVRYIQSLIEIIEKLREHGHTYSFDHQFPICFWTQDMIDDLQEADIDPIHNRQGCCDKILGLLDTNFDLWYCNQTGIKIGNVFVNGKPRTMDEIHRMIRHMPNEKVQQVTLDKCMNCPAQITCKTACWFKHARS